MSPYWSYLLTAVGAFGLFLAGRKIWWAWGVGIAAQVLWFTYAIATEQWGFIFSCFVYGYVYVKNWRSWRREYLASRVLTDAEVAGAINRGLVAWMKDELRLPGDDAA